MHYAERLTVPLRWWVQGTMLVATLWLALVVAVPEALAWTVTGAALATMAAFYVSWGLPRVGVEDGPQGPELRAGRAHVPVQFLGTPVPLDAEGTRRAAGVEADARAFLLLRPYLKRSLRVPVLDASDPVPYWLVSCRRPKRLAKAVLAAQERESGGTTPAPH